MDEHNASGTPGNRLIPAAKWPEYHPWPPPGGLRHLIFHAKSNGFSAVIVRIGRRVLIDEAAFFAWAKTHSKGKAASVGTPLATAASPSAPVAAAPESPRAAPRP